MAAPNPNKEPPHGTGNSTERNDDENQRPEIFRPCEVGDAEPLFERRNYSVDVEVRGSVEDGDGTKITGYAAVFDKLSDNLGGFREKIEPGAFKRSIGEKADVRALVNHETGLMTIGRTVSGTLTLREDKKGLMAEIDPPDTQAGRDVVELIRRGDLSQMSFGFWTKKDAWEHNDDEDIRTLLDVDLFDVSIVTFPAYPQTSVETKAAMRSHKTWRGEVGNGGAARFRRCLADNENLEVDTADLET